MKFKEDNDDYITFQERGTRVETMRNCELESTEVDKLEAERGSMEETMTNRKRLSHDDLLEPPRNDEDSSCKFKRCRFESGDTFLPKQVISNHLPELDRAHSLHILKRHYQQASSSQGAAVAILQSISHSLGMTLSQFSGVLMSVPDIKQALSTSSDASSKMNLAVSLYLTESRSMMKKCMLLSGFDCTEVLETSWNYKKFASQAHDIELLRLQNLNQHSEKVTDLDNHMSSIKSSDQFRKNRWKRNQNMDDVNNRQDDANVDSGFCRHFHRRGKCGHKPILHRPKGKPAHIDFIVGNTIECFEGIKPIGPRGPNALWPSSFSCEEICQKDVTTNAPLCGSNDSVFDNFDYLDQVLPPRKLSLNDSDFEGPEWNLNFFVDESEALLSGLKK